MINWLFDWPCCWEVFYWFDCLGDCGVCRCNELYLSPERCLFLFCFPFRVQLCSARTTCRFRTCRLPTCLRGWFRWLILFDYVMRACLWKLSVKVLLCDRSPCFATGPKWDFIRATFLCSWTTSKLWNRHSFLLCRVYSIAFMTRSVTFPKHWILLPQVLQIEFDFAF